MHARSGCRRIRSRIPQAFEPTHLPEIERITNIRYIYFLRRQRKHFILWRGITRPKRCSDQSVPTPGPCRLCNAFCNRPGILQHVATIHRQRIARKVSSGSRIAQSSPAHLRVIYTTTIAGMDAFKNSENIAAGSACSARGVGRGSRALSLLSTAISCARSH